jgi:hypothetical protein
MKWILDWFWSYLIPSLTLLLEAYYGNNIFKKKVDVNNWKMDINPKIALDYTLV